MTKTFKSISFRNQILSQLHLNDIESNPICPVNKKFRTNTNKISPKSIISLQQEITSIKTIKSYNTEIKPYNTKKVIKLPTSQYQISNIIQTQTYKKLQNKLFTMMSSHKQQKLKLKKQIKQIQKAKKQQKTKTNKFIDRLLQITQSYEETESDYYEIRRKNYALKCELLHRRRNSQSQVNWVNQFQLPHQFDIDRLSYEQILQMEERVGKQCTGLEQSDIEKLPHNILKDLQSNEDKSVEQEETICSICCDKIEKQQTVIRLECSHLHHSECLQKWLTIKASCPLCKRQVR